MKKRTLAILMILVLATTGLFAAYTVTVPGQLEATLTATIGEYLNHGFNVDGTKYQGSVTVSDAFGATAPSFKYGYKTNALGQFVFRMAVGNFAGSTGGTVKIASVGSSKGAIVLSGGFYTIFTDSTSTSTPRQDEATITITPATASGVNDHAGVAIIAGETVSTAASGDYTATLTFSIVAS